MLPDLTPAPSIVQIETASYPDLDDFTSRQTPVPRESKTLTDGIPTRADARPVLPSVGVSSSEMPDATHAAAPTTRPPQFAPSLTVIAPWRLWVSGVWLLGGLVSLSFVLVASRRFALALQDEPELSDGPHVAVLAECLRETGVRKPVALVVTDLVRTPAVHGVFRPRVLIPPALLASLSPDELRLVLRHELAHVRCHDGIANWALAGVRSVFWFHPIVAWALRRLDAQRESARDWMALGSSTGEPGTVPDAAAYGHILIRLLESTPARKRAVAVANLLDDRSDLRRRIAMLTSYRPSTRKGLVIGAFLLGVLGALTLTTAPLPNVLGQDSADPKPVDVRNPSRDGETIGQPVATSTEPLRRVHVVKQRPIPKWETALRAKLAKTFDVKLTGKLPDALARVRVATGANVILDPEYAEDLADVEVSVDTTGISGENFLSWALNGDEFDWCLADGAVFVGRTDRLPHIVERRYYNVRALLREATPAPEDEDDEPEVPDGELVDLVRTLISPAVWEREGHSLSPWKGLLLVDTTARVHEGVEGLLNLLLNRGRRPRVNEPRWKQDVEKRLDAAVSVKFEKATYQEAAAQLSKLIGVSVLIPNDFDDDFERLNLELDDVPARQALGWVTRFSQSHVVLRDGAAVVQRHPALVYRCYAVRDVLEGDLGGRDGMDDLTELIQSSTNEQAWEEWGSIHHWDDFFVISQTEAVHAQIENVLSALRRVLRTE